MYSRRVASAGLGCHLVQAVLFWDLQSLTRLCSWVLGKIELGITNDWNRVGLQGVRLVGICGQV